MASFRSFTGSGARLGFTLGLVVSTALFVGTVDGGHTSGHTSFTNNCALAGCHGAGGNDAYYNGANAQAVIDHAITGGMTVAPAGGTGELAAHIGSILPAPSNRNIPFHEGPAALGAGSTFNLQHIFHSTAWGGGATSSARSGGPRFPASESATTTSPKRSD